MSTSSDASRYDSVYDPYAEWSQPQPRRARRQDLNRHPRFTSAGKPLFTSLYDVWRDEIAQATRSQYAMTLAMVLYRRHKQDFEYQPVSLEWLGEEVHCDRVTVGRALDVLVKLRFVEVERRRGTYPSITWIRSAPTKDK